MRSRCLALLGGVLLLLPAGAIAQSAGDKQYTDPFAGESPPSRSQPQPSQGSSPPSGSNESSNAPALRSPGQLSQSPDQGASGAGSASSGGPLPRTGVESWALVLTGGLMLLGGVLLRLGLRPLPRRAAGGAPAILGRDLRLRRRARR